MPQLPANGPAPGTAPLKRWRYRYLIMGGAALVGGGTYLIGQLVFHHGLVAIIIVGAGYFFLLFFALMPYLAWRERKRR